MSTSKVDTSLTEKHIAAVQKRYPNKIGQDYDRRPPKIRTGQPEFDHITDGGIPLGRQCQFWGDFSSGKSLMCWKAVAAAQREGMKAVYYNIENQYTPEFAASQGVDTDALEVVEENKIEAIGDILQALLKTHHMHIVDSTSSAISVHELNADLGTHMQPGVNSKAWQRVLGRVEDGLNTDNSVIYISQARDKIGAFMGGQKPQGGKAIEFASSMTVQFSKGSWLFYNKDGYLDKDGEGEKSVSGVKEPDGTIMKAFVTKSRVCRPLRTAVMQWDFNKEEYDLPFELVKAGIRSSVIVPDKPGGSWYTLPDGTKAHGEKQLRAAIANSPDLTERILKEQEKSWQVE